MARNRKTDRKLKPFFKASIVLCILAAVLGLALSINATTYQMEKQTEVYITSEKDIKLHHTSMYNDTVYLSNDITVIEPETMVGSEKYPFEGTFNGLGHTIYFNYNTAEEMTSFFNYLAPSAVVENVNFVFNTPINVLGDSLGLIAKVNDGTIRNCKITFNGIVLTGAGMFSPVVTINRGTIENVVVEGEVSCGYTDTLDEAKVLFGSICVYNKNTVSNSIVDVKYTDFDCADMASYLEGRTKNVSIASIRYNDIEGGKINNVSVILSSDTITSDSYYYDDSSKVAFTTEDSEVYTSDNFKALHFDDEAWEVEKGETFYLITKEAAK